jgi:hypothetical protein
VCRKLSNDELDKWWEDIDCYILCSAGEGYSYTPREAILRGIPTIVSDCTAHSVLVKTKGVFGVKPTGKKPAYKHLWKKNVGEDYTFSINSVANAMGEVNTYFGEWKNKVKLAQKYIKESEGIKTVTEQLISILK